MSPPHPTRRLHVMKYSKEVDSKHHLVPGIEFIKNRNDYSRELGFRADPYLILHVHADRALPEQKPLTRHFREPDLHPRRRRLLTTVFF